VDNIKVAAGVTVKEGGMIRKGPPFQKSASFFYWFSILFFFLEKQ
jgi:hypothetical protein